MPRLAIDRAGDRPGADLPVDARDGAGARTIGALELPAMLADAEAVVIDSRTQIRVGAVNMPCTERPDALDKLGCEVDFEGFICGPEVPEVAWFCNGPWCGQSPTAIRRIIAAGYPAEKISYYRGGMQVWRMLGLTVTGE